MKKTIFAVILLLMFGFFVSINVAQDLPEDEQEMMPPRPMAFSHIPDLTPDQLSKIEKLRLEHQKEMLPIRTKMQALRLDLRTMIMEEQDQKKIDDKIEEIGKIRTELMKKQVKHRLAIRSLLTDDQKVYFDAIGMKLGKWLDCMRHQQLGPEPARRFRHRF